MEQMSKDQFRQHVMNNRGVSPGVLLKQLRSQGVAVEGDINNPAMKAPGVFEQNAQTFQDRRTGNFVNDVSAAAGMIGKDLSHVASSVFQPIDKAIGKAANFVGTGGGLLGRMDDDPSGPFQTLTEGLDLVHRGTDALGNSMADAVRGTPIHSAVKSLGASLDSFDAAHPNAKNILQDAADYAFGVMDMAFLTKGVEELPGQIGKLKPKPSSSSPAAPPATPAPPAPTAPTADVGNIPGTSTKVGESSVAGRIKGSLTAQVTGLDSNSQAAISDTATRGMISDMLTGKKAPDTAVERMGRTLDQIAEDVSDTGHEYDFVRNSKAVEPVDPSKFQKILQQYGLRFRPEGTVEQSAILKNPIQKGSIEVDPSGPGAKISPLVIKQLETFMQTVGGIDRVTPEVFKNAKSLLVEAGDFYDPSLPGGGSAKGVVGSMLKVLDGIRDNATTADFQAYKELDARYAPKIRALNEIRDLFEPDPANRGSFRIKDSARGKVLNALKGNKVNLINDLERVSPGITREIRAYETYQNIIRENTPGQYGRAMAKGAAVGFATGSLPGAAIGTVVGILASEPRFMFEVLSKVAGVKEFMGIKPKDIIFKAERGMPLGPKETAAVRAAAKEASQTTSTPGASPVGKGEGKSPATLPEPVPNVNGPKGLPRDGATTEVYNPKMAIDNVRSVIHEKSSDPIVREAGKYARDEIKPYIDDYLKFKKDASGVDPSGDYQRGLGLGEKMKMLDSRGAFKFENADIASLDADSANGLLKRAWEYHEGKPIQKLMGEKPKGMETFSLENSATNDLSSLENYGRGYSDAFSSVASPKTLLSAWEKMVNEGYEGLTWDTPFDDQGNTMIKLYKDAEAALDLRQAKSEATKAISKGVGIGKEDTGVRSPDFAGQSVDNLLKEKPEAAKSLNAVSKFSDLAEQAKKMTLGEFIHSFADAKLPKVVTDDLAKLGYGPQSKFSLEKVWNQFNSAATKAEDLPF